MAALVLGACVAAEPDDGLPPEGACGAKALQDLIGQPRSVLDVMRFSQPLRVIEPGMAVTEDYNPGRLNIELDDVGQIIRVACG